MKSSNTEFIVERYYRLKNWLVERDVPILPQTVKKHWSDLDILAVGSEVHLINCKDYLQSDKVIYKVIKNLEDSELYIKKVYSHLEGKTFKKIYVYGGTGINALNEVAEKGIEAIEVSVIFLKYVKLLDEYLNKMNNNRNNIKIGKRYYIMGELDGVDKFVSFLLNNNYLNDEAINIQLKKINLEPLSKPKTGKNKKKPIYDSLV